MTQKPDDVSRPQPIKPFGEEQRPAGSPTQGQAFEQYMEKAAGQPSGQPTALSPFDLAQGQTMLSAAPNFDTLMTQVKSAQSMLGDINSQLNTPNLRLKQSQRYLLRTKLTDANTHLRAANSKMGSNLPEGPPTSASGGILGKFLDYISEGQSNLQAAQNQISALKDKGDNLKPADFLAIQLKLAHAQQEIEYASIMLSKVVDDMKTLFNVQL